MITFDLIAATPHALKLLATGDEDGNIDISGLDAFLAAGPLKDLLDALTVDEWVGLQFAGSAKAAQLSVYVTPTSDAEALLGVKFVAPGGVKTFRAMVFQGGGNVNTVVEFRFNHSSVL